MNIFHYFESEFSNILAKLVGQGLLPKNLDATDGLAAAVCHHFNTGQSNTKKNYSGWASFVTKNPKKVHG